MNDEDTDFTTPSDEENSDTASEETRPIGYWLRAVDRLISREFADAFAEAGIDRRDWMLLGALAGDVELPAFAERFARKGKRLRGLAERGWVEEQGDGTWTLTDEGRAARERLSAAVDGIRSRIADAVSPEDYATTVASLEAMARELGWEEGQRMPRGGFGRGFGPGFGRDFGPGFDRGFGRGFGRGSGPGFGPGHGPGFGPGHGPGARHWHPDHHEHHGGSHHEHHEHSSGGHRGRGERRSAERAYERGFDAGFARGRSADSA